MMPTPSGSRVVSPFSNCTTRIEPVRLSQRWRIENFSTALKLSRPGCCLRSQVFKNPKFSDACWQLCLYPGGKRDENAGFVSLFLKMSATNPGKEVLQRAEYRFYFLDDAGTHRFSNINIGEFHAKPPKGGHSWGLRNIPRQKVQNSLREDDSLLIVCEVELLPDVNRIRSQEDRPTAVNASDLSPVPQSFLDAQRRLFDDGIFTDYLIEVAESGAQFPVHRCFLGAHSQVFRAMLAHEDLMENAQGRLVIEDFSEAAVRVFLVYLYTGTMSEREEADQVLGLAEKYGLSHLKAACEDLLAAKLDQSNVCQLLALADLHRADVLKAACQALIAAFKKDVLASDAWRQLKQQNPRLTTETLEELMCRSDSQPPPKKARL